MSFNAGGSCHKNGKIPVENHTSSSNICDFLAYFIDFPMKTAQSWDWFPAMVGIVVFNYLSKCRAF
jgi:hypothetical protein